MRRRRSKLSAIAEEIRTQVFDFSAILGLSGPTIIFLGSSEEGLLWLGTINKANLKATLRWRHQLNYGQPAVQIFLSMLCGFSVELDQGAYERPKHRGPFFAAPIPSGVIFFRQ